MKKAIEILAQNVRGLIGPDGIYKSNAQAAEASYGGVSRSTFDRIRNADRPGASIVSVDKLDGVAQVFRVKPWQLFVPGMDPRGPLPALASERSPEASLTPDEWALICAYRKLARKEQAYLLADAEKYAIGPHHPE